MNEINVEADIVVAGGGLAGTFAAIASARLGCRTVLIQDRPVLGGNASSELLVGISGADCSGGALTRYARETGLIDEFALSLLHRSSNYASSAPLHSVILWEMVKKEPNLSCYLNTSVRGVKTDSNGNITSILANQTSTEKDFVFAGKIFIDCTGHGTLGYLAGAKFRMGREARTEFRESMALEIADNKTMGNSLIFCARDMGRPVPFIPPAWARKFPKDEDLPFRHPAKEKIDQQSDEAWGYWWIEYGGQRNTIGDAEEIHDELLRILFGVWDHMKNTGDHGVANYAITWISPFPSRRESRRIIGDYIMNENDLRERTVFPDRVAYGGWPIDIHPPEGIYSKEPPCSHEYLSSLCSIPLRSLYSKNVPNLLFAGRNISVTHVALGTVRVMATCAVMGQAAGTAAALCSRHQVMPRELQKKFIHALQQQLIKDDCYIVGVHNEDADDLTCHAVVTASSEQTLSISQADGWHELTQPCAQMFPVSAGRIETIDLYLRSTHDAPVTARLVLHAAKGINDFESDQEIAAATAVVKAGQETWVRFNLNTDIAPNGFYRVHLPAIPDVFWAVQSHPPLGTNRAVFLQGESPAWRSFSRSGALQNQRGVFLFRLHPESKPYGPANVRSGMTRPETWTNIWISDPHEALPHFVDVLFSQPRMIHGIRLVFDDDLDTNIYLPPPWGRMGQGIPETLVKDYRLLTQSPDGWKELLTVHDNYQRCRVHDVNTIRTDGLRIECLTTHGTSEARIYEIRVYGPEKPRQDLHG